MLVANLKVLDQFYSGYNMLAKKKQKEKHAPVPQEVEEQEEDVEMTQEQRFQQMETRLTKKFESQFLQFQKAIEKIATKANESNKPEAKGKASRRPKILMIPEIRLSGRSTTLKWTLTLTVFGRHRKIQALPGKSLRETPC